MNLKISVPKGPALAIQLLMDAGFEAGVVGGCNRDAIMGKTPDDWDICTSATPEEIQSVFRNFKQLIIGLKHGTITILIDKEPIEITTYRIDGEYSDGRRPDYVAFTRNLIEDLSRRDYTINAIFYNDIDGCIDPFNGVQDIASKIIRCVGDADKRLQEDALRILRGMRFASKLGFDVEHLTKQAMFNNMALLKNVSQERITVEFIKLLQGNEAIRILDEFKTIISYILPEMKPTMGFYEKEATYDLWQHSLIAFKYAPDFIVKLTLFFHEIGKPMYCQNTNNTDTSIGKLSAEITAEVFKRMRLTNAEAVDKNDLRDIIELIRYHDMPIEPSKIGVRKMLSLLSGNVLQFNRLLCVKKADYLAMESVAAKNTLEQLVVIETILHDVLAEKPCTTLKDLNISGRDLLSIGVPKGETIGELLNKLLDDVINEKIKNSKENLLTQAQKYLK